MSSNSRRTPVTRPDLGAFSLKTNILQKGSTFHSPISPPSSPETTTFRPPAFPLRSQTSLEDVIDSHRRRVALTLDNIDKTLSATQAVSPSAMRTFCDDSLPIPRGVLNHMLGTIMAKEPVDERRVLRPRSRCSVRNDHSDSGLGTSLKFKRSASQELEDEEEILRSMARRKKNASPEELAPKKCREPGCTKEFKRPCDLTKHEKTHSRPWKCPVPTCKYHDYGWPTEKEMDRHHNDKHSSAPPMYECLFKPCPYKSKRESNCKQHMEKAHGWTYVRTKSNGKRPGMLSSDSMSNTAHNRPQPHCLPTPSSDFSTGVATPPEDFNAYYNNIEFPTYLPSATDFNIPQELTIDHLPHDVNGTPSSDYSVDRNSAFQDVGNDFTLHEDIYGATIQLPHAAHHIPSIYRKEIPQPQYPRYTPADIGPQSTAHLSPIGQGSAMLYTPTSLGEVDEGFDDNQDFAIASNQGGDFVLFPGGGVSKPVTYDPLFVSEVPSMGTGLSRHASQDVIAQAIQQQMGWSSYEFSHYSGSQH